MRPVKIQISLRIRAVWSEASLGKFLIPKNAKFFHAINVRSDQTARKPILTEIASSNTPENLVQTLQNSKNPPDNVNCSISLFSLYEEGSAFPTTMHVRPAKTQISLWVSMISFLARHSLCSQGS